MGIDGSERTGLYALITGNALRFIKLYDAVNPFQCVCWAYLGTYRNFALTAGDGHSNDWVGVHVEHSYRGLMGIIYSEMFNGTNQLTDAATATLLWNNH